MEISVKDVLEKILLPVSSGWVLDNVTVDEKEKAINVTVKYCSDTILINDGSFSIYDLRPEREWRHLDLWEYKTFIKARVPRYKTVLGEVKSLEVPWADAYERMTLLLEKKQ